MEFTDYTILITAIVIVAWAFSRIKTDWRSARKRWKKRHPKEFNWGV